MELEPWNGFVPKPVRIEGDFVLAEIRIKARYQQGLISVPVGEMMGVWNRHTGKSVHFVPGTELLEFVPGRSEVAGVRVEVRADAKGGGTSRADYRWFFERYKLPGGEQISTYEIDDRLSRVGWLAQLSFAEKDKGRVAKVLCGDESHSYSFYIELSEKGDRQIETPAERARKIKLLSPEKRAANLRTPSEELGALADETEALALIVAQNPAAPVALLARLAGHVSIQVRAAVAGHGALTPELQKRLAADPEAEVRANIPHVSEFYDLQREKFSRPKREESVLEALARDPEPPVRQSLARIQRIPASIERILAGDPESKVRLKLCQTRYEIDAEALKSLAADKNGKVRDAAAKLRPR